MTDEEIISANYGNAKKALSVYRSKQKAKDQMREDGLLEVDAGDLVDFVFRNNAAANRKIGLIYLLVSVISGALLIVIFAVFHRLYFIALPFAAFIAIKGLFKILLPSGFEVKS